MVLPGLDCQFSLTFIPGHVKGKTSPKGSLAWSAYSPLCPVWRSSPISPWKSGSLSPASTVTPFFARPCHTLWTPARLVRSNALRQPWARARRLPAERRRPARARDPARGGARPRGCVGPARPGPAGPWTGQCPWRGRGSRPEGSCGPRWSHQTTATALRCHSRPGPTRLPGRASLRLSPSRRQGGALRLPRLVGDPACPSLPRQPLRHPRRAQRFRCVPARPHPRFGPPGTALSRGWTVRLGTGLLASALLSG